MGWLKRLKKDGDGKSGHVQNEPVSDAEKPGREKIMGDRQTELGAIEKEILKKRAALTSLFDKLGSVKEEYENAVDNLMDTKKRRNDKRKEVELLTQQQQRLLEQIGSAHLRLDAANIEIMEKKKITAELDKAGVVLAETKSEIAKSQSHADRIREKIIGSQSALDQIVARQQQAEIDLEKTADLLKGAKFEIANLDSIRAGQSSTMEEKNIQEPAVTDKAADKQVVEAASAVVASMTQKLRTAEKELAIIKKVLENERREHAITREKLAKSQSKP